MIISLALQGMTVSTSLGVVQACVMRMLIAPSQFPLWGFGLSTSSHHTMSTGHSCTSQEQKYLPLAQSCADTRRLLDGQNTVRPVSDRHCIARRHAGDMSSSGEH